ncbi:MAG: 2-oxoacid:ferredoxin oxidoreductase subunit beta [Candidatus Omnitrophica bacterium]|nr:2-oxoacid:ferredoxin oxidoreductase subunit beta [Candidatus Omnitrophota bacterium]
METTKINPKNLSEKPLTMKDFKTDVHIDWCPGCGDFGITASVQQALAELKFAPWRVTMVSGVGCSSKTPHFIKTYGIHSLHGRTLAFALGAKMANPEIEVVAVGGDGDGYGIGAAHFVHAGRRNVDLAYIVYNNEVYGLTKGQASPTLKRGEKPKSLPLPNVMDGVNPLALALSSGYTFIARSYAFAGAHLKETIKRAILHRGMALVDVLQPCPTYNDLHTKEWFAQMVESHGQQKPRCFDIEKEGYDSRVKDASNEEEVLSKKKQAFEMAYYRGEQVPIGVFYQIDLPTYYDRIAVNAPILNQYTPVTLPTQDPSGKPTSNLSSALASYLV